MRHRVARRGVRPANPIAVVAIACAWAVIVAAGPAFAAPIKVACIGEHTTHGDLYPPNNRESQPPGMQEYPAMLQTLLGAQYDVRNFGDCCATVQQGYAAAETHPYVLGPLAGRGPGYPDSLAFLPDIVVIGSWGRHDWGASHGPCTYNFANFQKDYDDLVQRYMKLASHPKIYVSLPIPIVFGQGTVPDNGVTTESVLPAIKAVAAKYNLPIIDLYTAFLGRKDLFRNPPLSDSEGEHINDTGGFQHIAETVFAALTGASDGGGGSQDAAAGTDAAAVDEGGPASPGPEAGATDEAGTPSSGTPAGVDSGGSVVQGGGSGGGDEAGAANGASGSPSGSAAGTGNSGSSGSSCSMTARAGHPAPIALLAATIFSLLVARRRKPNRSAITATTRRCALHRYSSPRFKSPR